MIIYTIGHSNVDVDEVVRSLEEYEIEMVLDVRSSPYSRFAPQFNREPLAEHLHMAGIEYVYAGQYLGGRPKDPSCYDQDDDSKVLYGEIENKEWYQQGIDRQLDALADSLIRSDWDPYGEWFEILKHGDRLVDQLTARLSRVG